MIKVNQVLLSDDYSTETKLNAIIAVGDMCLAAEDEFIVYLDSTMQCLNSAANMSVQSDSAPTDEDQLATMN